MSDLRNTLAIFWPVLAGIAYFIVVYVLVDDWIVRKRRFSEFQLRVIDFVWAAVLTLQLAFVLISAREGTLDAQIQSLQTQSSQLAGEVKEQLGRGSDDCLKGAWPPGAARRQSTTGRNGLPELPPPCMAVSRVTYWFPGFFDRTQRLWIDPGLNDLRTRFADAFEQSKRRAEQDLRDSGLDSEPLGKSALADLSRTASTIVTWKTEVAQLSVARRSLAAVGAIGFYWPIITATSLAFALAKARLAMRDAKDRQKAKAQELSDI